MKELPSPPDAANDPEAAELLRAWVVAGDLHCSLRANGFADPGTWGLLLADVVRNVAEALHEQEGRQPADTIRSIRDAFEAEMRSPPTPRDNPGAAP